MLQSTYTQIHMQKKKKSDKYLKQIRVRLRYFMIRSYTRTHAQSQSIKKKYKRKLKKNVIQFIAILNIVYRNVRNVAVYIQTQELCMYLVYFLFFCCCCCLSLLLFGAFFFCFLYSTFDIHSLHIVIVLKCILYAICTGTRVCTYTQKEFWLAYMMVMAMKVLCNTKII